MKRKWICTSMEEETASCKRHEGRKEVSPSPTPDGKWVPQETRKQARMIFMATRPTITAAAEKQNGEPKAEQNGEKPKSTLLLYIYQLNYTNELPTFHFANICSA